MQKGNTAMSSLVERAAKGNRKSMTILYEAYKNELYSFCFMLFCNKQKAGIAMANVMNGIWVKLLKNNISSKTEFRHLLFVEAAKHCFYLMFRKRGKEFIIDESFQIKSELVFDKMYTGNISEEMMLFQRVLSKIEPQRRYIYLLYIVGNLNFKEISQIVNQEENVTRYWFETAAKTIVFNLDQMRSEGILIEDVKSLVEQASMTECIPKAINSLCLKRIKSCSKITLTFPVVIFIIICGILLCITVFSFSYFLHNLL